MNEAEKRYMQSHKQMLEKENKELRNTLVDLHQVNKWLWLALAIMSLLTLIQSVILW